MIHMGNPLMGRRFPGLALLLGEIKGKEIATKFSSHSMNAISMSRRAEGFLGQRIVVLPRQVVASALQQGLIRYLLPTDVGYFPKAAGHFMRRAPGIDQTVFIYCVKGQGWCELAGTRHEIRAGELLVVPSRTDHVYGADPDRPWTIFWMHVKGEHVPSLQAEFGTTEARPVLFIGENPELLALFEELLDVLEHGYATSRLLYASQILTHLLGLMLWDRHRNWRGVLDAAQKVAQSIAYMKQHLDQRATAASLAALANLSESHYRSIFKRQTGYAPMDYLIRLRMHKACQLLDTTQMNVKEIATAVGYVDPLYFSRVFKAVIELSPSQYRLAHKG